MVTLLCVVVDDDTDGCYMLFPIQLQYQFTLLHNLQRTTQALTVQCIRLCSVIVMTKNNSASCSVGHIPEHLRGDTIKSTSYCLFKVIGGLVALPCNSLLYVFAEVTRHCGHAVHMKRYPTFVCLTRYVGKITGNAHNCGYQCTKATVDQILYIRHVMGRGGMHWVRSINYYRLQESACLRNLTKLVNIAVSNGTCSKGRTRKYVTHLLFRMIWSKAMKWLLLFQLQASTWPLQRPVCDRYLCSSI
jgi:hypothetical protein